MMVYHFILIYLAILIIVVTSYITFRILLFRSYVNKVKKALRQRDCKYIITLLSNKNVIKAVKKAKLSISVLDLVFDCGFFDSFLKYCEKLDTYDKCKVLSSGADIVGIDLETFVEENNTRIREYGVYVYSSRLNEGFGYRRTFDIESANWLRSFLNFTKPKVIVGHNISRHDIPLLEKEGIEISAPIVDTLTLSLIAIPEAASHSLEYLSDIFSIQYEPHIPDEDAKASVILSKKLLTVLIRKNILRYVLKSSYPELSGLNSLTELLKPIKQEATQTKEYPEKIDVRKNTIIIVPIVNNSCDNNVWCPRKIDINTLRNIIDHLSDLELLSATIMLSAIMDGICDATKILEKLKVRDDIAESFSKLCENKVCFEPKLGEEVIVEAKYLPLLIEKIVNLKRRYRSAKVKRFFAVSLLAHRSPEEILGMLRRVSQNITVTTYAPQLIKDDVFVEKEELESIYGVEECKLIGARNLNIIYSYVNSLTENSIVMVTTKYGKLACRKMRVNFTERIEELFRDRRIIIPTLYDLVILTKKLSKLDVSEFLVALRELFPHREIWLIQGWGRLSNIQLISQRVKPKPLSFDIQPVVFSNRREALNICSKFVKEHWGFELRPYQKRAILHVLQPYIENISYGNPLTVVILPTGSGKSLIFQSTAIALNKVAEGVTVVISPLLALIEDQVNGLKRRNIEVCRIDGTVSMKEKIACLEKAIRGRVPIVYMTPEQLQNPYFVRLFREGAINYVVFDEAHTPIKWGTTFRPSYIYALKLMKELREKGFWVPIAMFTATLPEKDLKLLLNRVGVDNYSILDLDMSRFDENEALPNKPRVLKGPVLRTNLELSGILITNPTQRLSELANTVKTLTRWAENLSKNKSWIGVVFTPFVRSSRKEENAKVIAEHLSKALGEKVEVFHGQLSREEREKTLEKLYKTSKGEVKEPRIVVATKAFGMGVDIPNIRWIVHYMMSESIEDYYQEIGRSGRDGILAKAFLLYAPGHDFRRRMTLIKMQRLRPFIVKIVWDAIVALCNATGEKEVILPLDIFKRKYLLRGMEVSQNFSELMEVLVEKSLNVLASLGVLDYEVFRGKIFLCEDGYPIAKSGDTIVKACFTKGEERIIKISPKTFNISYDGVKVGGFGKYYVITVNNLAPINYQAVCEEVRKQTYLEMIKLVHAMRLANYIAHGKIDDAKKMIIEYFELGAEKFDEKVMAEILKKIIGLAVNEGLRIREKHSNIAILIIPYQATYKMPPYKRKQLYARALAYGIAYAVVRYKLVPDLTVVLTPYGYREEILRTLENIEAMIQIPIQISTVNIVTFSTQKIEPSIRKIMRYIKRKDPTTTIIALRRNHKYLITPLERSCKERQTITVILEE